MKNLKILFVEDEPDVSEFISRMLTRLGHEVIASVITGETALQLAPHLIPDLVVTDVFLAGGINGITLANTINSRYGIPSVIISGEEMECLIRSDESIRSCVFLSKPFSSSELAEAISRAYNREPLSEVSGMIAQTAEPLQTANSKGKPLNRPQG